MKKGSKPPVKPKVVSTKPMPSLSSEQFSASKIGGIGNRMGAKSYKKGKSS